MDFDPAVYRTLRRKAMDLLARREHSARELRDKLARGGADQAIVEAVVSALGEEGLQSDARFTEAFVHHRRGRGFGPRHVRADLAHRGVCAAQLDAVIDPESPEWDAALRRLVRSKYRGEPASALPERARRYRFLQSRGFTREQIERALWAQSENSGDAV